MSGGRARGSRPRPQGGQALTPKPYKIVINRDGGYETGTPSGPISGSDGVSGSFSTLEEAVIELVNSFGADPRTDIEFPEEPAQEPAQETVDPDRFSIYLKNGEYCTAVNAHPMSDSDGMSGGYDTLEDAIASIVGVFGRDGVRAEDIDLSQLDRPELKSAGWADDHVWDLDGVKVTEREFNEAREHFEATGERPDWWTAPEPEPEPKPAPPVFKRRWRLRWGSGRR